MAWASSTGAFCSRIRCNWARASGDVTGRWALTTLIFAALAGETLSARMPNSRDSQAQAIATCAGHDVSAFRHHRVTVLSLAQETSNSMSLIDRSASPPDESSNRLQSTSAELPPLAPCRSASRWHLMQYVA